MLFIAGAKSEDIPMEILQYILCCIVILILPPVTWIFGLIYWILKGCKRTLFTFTLEDVAICEHDNNMNPEELVILQQMLDDFRLNTKNKI